MSGFGILGMGVDLPGPAIGNAEVCTRIEADPDWIETRTGILTRHVAPPSVMTSELATAAAAKAVTAAGTDPEVIIVGTVTPDRRAPAMAFDVQRGLGLSGVPGYDVNACCVGFVQALASAWGLARCGVASTALVIGADTITRLADPADRRTAPLFGDGAGAVVCGSVPDGYGLLAADFWGDGRYSEVGSVSRDPERPYMIMDGREATRIVRTYVPQVLDTALERAGLARSDLHRVVFHQANPVLVERLGAELGLAPETVPVPGRLTGNTCSATVALALAMSHDERPLRRGDLVALAAVGAGAAAGAIVLRWY